MLFFYLHSHRHPLIFGLILLIVEFFVLIGILGFKIVRKIGAFLFLGLFPDFLRNALTIAHSGCFALLCVFLSYFLGSSWRLVCCLPLCQITIDLVFNQPNNKRELQLMQSQDQDESQSPELSL